MYLLRLPYKVWLVLCAIGLVTGVVTLDPRLLGGTALVFLVVTLQVRGVVGTLGLVFRTWGDEQAAKRAATRTESQAAWDAQEAAKAAARPVPHVYDAEDYAHDFAEWRVAGGYAVGPIDLTATYPMIGEPQNREDELARLNAHLTDDPPWR
jgi:hypothetical protein